MAHWAFILSLVISAIGMALSATAQEQGNRGDGHDYWHGEFYQKLVTPETKVSCCNIADCRPTEGREAKGNYEVKINGAWVAVLPSKIVKTSAPDGGFHVCAPALFDGNPEHVYCVVLPPEG